MNKIKVLITGCAGLLGANFSRYLTDKNYNVIGIDDLSGGYIESVDPKSKFYIFNLLDLKTLEKLFDSERPDYVFHFAAYAAEGLSPYIRNYNYTNNVLCSVNVINCCIKYDVKKLIFTSSMAVYGEGNPPFSEDQLPSPADPYGIAKYAVEMDIIQAHKHFDLNYSIVRPHNVLGVYQNIWDKYRNVIGIWIRQAISNEKLSIFGDGTQTRAFSDIKFYCEPFEKLMTNFDSEIFNIGADKYYQIIEAAELVKKIALDHGLKADINMLEPRNEVKDAYCDHTKAQRMLNFTDNTNLEVLINNMFEWARTIPAKKIRYMDYEIEKNMYSFWQK